jgi:hypothetical protein
LEAFGLKAGPTAIVQVPVGNGRESYFRQNAPESVMSVAPGAIAENKRLGEALAFARELQASYPPNRRRGDPRRQRPPNNLGAPGVPTKGRPSRKVLAAAAE